MNHVTAHMTPQPIPEVLTPTEPAGRWIGTFATTNEFRVEVEATIHLIAGIVDGKGFAKAFPRHARSHGSHFSIEGTLSSGAVEFSIWISDADFFHYPLHFCGVLNMEETQMKGTWELACIYPDTCACAGTRGSFYLQRVERGDGA